jgi:hypothetical protein
MINLNTWFYRYVGNEYVKEVLSAFGLMNEKFEKLKRDLKVIK